MTLTDGLGEPISDPTVLQVAMDCVERNAGIPKAVEDFRRALGGAILSFTAPGLIPEAGAPDVIHLPTGDGPVVRGYGMPERQAVEQCARTRLRRVELIVVHGLYRYHAQWGAAFARARRIPYWVVPHGALDPWVFSYRSLQKRAWMRLIGSRVLREARSVVVATAREAEKAARHLAGCRVRVAHLPVTPVAIEGREEARTSVREQLGIPNDARILLFLGRLHPMKRVLETIDAVHRAARPAVHLVVVGPSSPDLSIENCRARAHALGAGNVHIMGPSFGAGRDRWLLGADALISLSHRENFNYAAAEALSAGLPVILSPGNDLASELAVRGVGWLLKSFAPQDEVEAVRDFGAAPVERLRAMGAAGARWAATELSEDAFRTTLHQLRDGALSESSRS